MRKSILLCVMMFTAMAGYAQYQLDTLVYAGDSKNFLDIVYLGDGFKANEMNSFVRFVKNQNNKFFKSAPWTRYKSMFNVFMVKTPSNESGAGMTPDQPIDNFYGTCFGTAGVDRMPWPTKWDKLSEVLWATKPDYDMVAIVVNSTKYGGGGGGGFICFTMEESSIETLRHEAGHALGGLADEYWYRGYEAANMTQILDPLKWQHWIGKYNIGTYRYSDDESEEAYTWYRPHQDCLMRYLYSEYCAVCREALIEVIHENSKNVLSYEPDENDVSLRDDDITFSLNLLKPRPNTLRVDWMLDDALVAHNKEEYTIEAGSVPEGTYRLTALVEDTIQLVRVADHTTLHSTTVSWDLKIEIPSGIQVVSHSVDEFRVGPLPFDSYITFSSKQPVKEQTRVDLLNMAGMLMASDTFEDDSDCRLSTSQLIPGIYILRVIKNGQLVYSRKVTKR